MKQSLITLALAMCFAGTAGAAMTKDEYKAQKDRVQADYKAGKDRCGALKDNAKDICKAEVKGKYEVAKAELEAQHEPSPRHDAKVRSEKAAAAHAVAKEKCDDLSGNAKDVCKKDAKAAFVSAKADNKVSKAGVDDRKEARVDKNDAMYSAAKERCDALKGDAKDGCVADARKKFGKT